MPPEFWDYSQVSAGWQMLSVTALHGYGSALVNRFITFDLLLMIGKQLKGGYHFVLGKDS